MVMVVVLMIMGVIMVVLHDGDCDVGDGSCGDIVVDREDDMLMVMVVMMVGVRREKQ